jgi:hypothetical protein
MRASERPIAEELREITVLPWSRLYFVYPFKTDERLEELAAIGGKKWPGRDETIWVPTKVPKDDLIEHLARYLNPQPPDNASATGLFWDLSENARKALIGAEVRAEWRYTTPHSTGVFKFDSFRIGLFRFGIGFLIVQARPQSNDASDWFDFLHYFRYWRGDQSATLEASPQGELRPEKRLGPILGRNEPAAWKWKPGALLEELMEASLGRRWWRDFFEMPHLLPFANLFLQGPHEAESERVSALVYRARNLFHARQRTGAWNHGLQASGVSQYDDNQFMYFSIDGGGFLAYNPPAGDDFFKITLSDHLGRQYLLAFVLALAQRFTLLRVSADVADAAPTNNSVDADAELLAEYDRILRKTLDFTARGWFAQAMHSEHHHVAYREWLTAFQIDNLYREVRDEVADISEYLARRDSDRAEEEQRRKKAVDEEVKRRDDQALFLVTALAGAVGVPLIFLGYLALLDLRPRLEIPVLVGLAIPVAAGILGILIIRLFLRWQDHREPDKSS